MTTNSNKVKSMGCVAAGLLSFGCLGVISLVWVLMAASVGEPLELNLTTTLLAVITLAVAFAGYKMLKRGLDLSHQKEEAAEKHHLEQVADLFGMSPDELSKSIHNRQPVCSHGRPAGYCPDCARGR